MTVRILIFLAIVLAIDFYVFQAVKLVTRAMPAQTARTISIVYWSMTVYTFVFFLSGIFIDWHTWPKPIRSYGFALAIVFLISKLFVVLFLLIDDLTRFVRWGIANLYQHFWDPPVNTPAEGKVVISRSDFLIKIGLVISAIPFVSLIYGMVKGAYDYQVKRKKIVLKNLPPAFNGFTFVQISDIHSGSFFSTEPLKKAVEIINGLKPDAIFFTGDLVNDKSDEVVPHMETLSKLKAQHGVYSILGNHDYGDYVQWPSREAKVANLERLKNIHRQMGWNIMLDEHTFLEKGNAKIGLIGIQNWSSHLRFPKYGNMEKATAGMNYAPVNILLSHDPSHWRSEVLEQYPNVDLMLAGHTHGFQFGVEIPGFKWSPVQYVYKEWADLYREGERMLYVNRGLGFLGYPGRVGILPEITLVELVSA